jgi:hypothetical protein
VRIYVTAEPLHQLRAIKTDYGWAFQHVQTQQYLGVLHNIVLDEAAQIVGVAKPFTWMIIPYHGEEGTFRYVKKSPISIAQQLEPESSYAESVFPSHRWLLASTRIIFHA